jgi:serine/threonine protein kinase
VAENNLRPTLPADCPPAVTSLIQSCLEAIPDKRPSAIQILEQIEDIKIKLNV